MHYTIEGLYTEFSTFGSGTTQRFTILGKKRESHILEVKTVMIFRFAIIFTLLIPSLTSAQTITVQGDDGYYKNQILTSFKTHESWFGQSARWRGDFRIILREGKSSGVTRYVISNNYLSNPSGEWTGSHDTLIKDVIPHETFHVAMASYYGRSMPRWLDEGMAQLQESKEFQQKVHKNLLIYLKNRRGIPFNQMVAYVDYPADVQAFYAQSFSVCYFLQLHADNKTLVDFANQASNDPNQALKDHYDYTLDDLQLAWVDWLENDRPVPKEVNYQCQMQYVPGRGWVQGNCTPSTTPRVQIGSPTINKGADGADGADGKDGRGVESIDIVDGKLIIKYTDGTDQSLDLPNQTIKVKLVNKDTGKVVGEDEYTVGQDTIILYTGKLK